MHARRALVWASVAYGQARRGEQAAAVHIFEIAIREFVSSLRIRTVPLVDSEVPLCIFAEAVQTDELVFFVC